ncbi:MAG: hypothetical protein R2695_17475 [Acidimicrobiales bacterium]
MMRIAQQRGYVDEVARDPGPGQAVLYGTVRPRSSSASASTRSASCRRSASSSGNDVVEALERGCGPPPDEDLSEDLPTRISPTWICPRICPTRTSRDGVTRPGDGPADDGRIRRGRAVAEGARPGWASAAHAAWCLNRLALRPGG